MLAKYLALLQDRRRSLSSLSGLCSDRKTLQIKTLSTCVLIKITLDYMVCCVEGAQKTYGHVYLAAAEKNGEVELEAIDTYGFQTAN